MSERKLDPSTATKEEIEAALKRVRRGVRLNAERAQPAARLTIPTESLLERLRRLSGDIDE